MKSLKDPRHKARMRLIETLYAKKVNPQTLDLPDNIYKYDKLLVGKILEVINLNKENFENILIKTSGRELFDIKNIEYVVIEVALAESYFSKLTPYKVAIDEAIELARDYGDESSSVFVSGVLGAIFDQNNTSNFKS